MRQKGIVIGFAVSFIILISVSVFFIFQGKYQREWKNQTMLRMEVPYEREHPTGRAAEYFAGLVNEASDGQMEIAVTYNTKPGSARDIVAQLQFGGIAFTAVNYFDLCEEIAELNRFVDSYDSPAAAQEGYRRQMEGIGEYLSKERMEILSCYRPDYRCIAGKTEPGSGSDFSGLKLHATKAAALSVYLLGLGAEIQNYGRTDLLKAVDSGYIDGSEMPFLLYGRAGVDKVMPYVWIYDDFLVPDMLVVSTVSLGNLTAEQQKLLLDCAGRTEEFQLEALLAAQQRQWDMLGERGVSTVLNSLREQED